MALLSEWGDNLFNAISTFNRLGHTVKPKNESRSITSEKPETATGHQINDAPSVDEASPPVRINFHSPQFNQADNLNDFFGECCAYEPLGDIVTADMRHQMERLRRCDSFDPPTDSAVPAKETENEAAIDSSAAPMTVISEGRTLIVDTDSERAIACGKILNDQGLNCTLLMTECPPAGNSFSRPAPRGILKVDAVAITGAFGGFSATATLNGNQKALAELIGGEATLFDLVLDLQPVPSYKGNLLPMGYYVPGPGAAALDEAMAELPEMRGRFKKPQFTSFREALCLHGRSRTHDCRRCLDICPVGAIQSVNRRISVNHYLCQGCGGCTLVCPTDAISLLEPSREVLLKALEESLNHRPTGADPPTTLLISDLKTIGTADRPVMGEGKNDLPAHFEAEQIGYAGLDLILAAFVHGARRVVVACRTQNPPGVTKAVEWQTKMAGAILKGLGLPEDSVRFTLSGEDLVLENAVSASAGIGSGDNQHIMLAAPPSPGRDLRTRVRRMAQHLYDLSGIHEPRISLPAGSPFGAVTVDTAACTLCKACATVCPSGALSASGDMPRLTFLESRCHQCGLCEEACPEGAIRLLPRLFCDSDTVEAPAVLHEAQSFRCVVCGAPFASPAMITRMEKKLAGHRMYAHERQMRRLRMCRTCRTRDTLISRDVSLWNR